MKPRHRPSWKSAFKAPRYRANFFFTLLLLLGCAWIAPVLFQWIEHRPGYALYDPLLDLLPAHNYSNIIFILLYFLIAAGIIRLMLHPIHFLIGLQSYLAITVMRFITLLITPLEAPHTLVLLQDPFIDKLIYQQSITKDLFFSGHTGLMALFAFLFHYDSYWKWFYTAGAIIIGILLLLQHAHYTLDVIAAPFFAWIAYFLATRFYQNKTIELPESQK
jgi:hypothetical protein